MFYSRFSFLKIYQAGGVNLLHYIIFSNMKKRDETSITSPEIKIFYCGNIFPKVF